MWTYVWQRSIKIVISLSVTIYSLNGNFVSNNASNRILLFAALAVGIYFRNLNENLRFEVSDFLLTLISCQKARKPKYKSNHPPRALKSN